MTEICCFAAIPDFIVTHQRWCRMKKIQEFQAQQIVFLQSENIRLYTEVIQVIESRQMCWVRPLILADLTALPPLVTDMRETSDLFWSIFLFQPAFDTEVINLLSQVIRKDGKSETDLNAKEQLHSFLRLICQKEV
jgi:hypothetical protein